MSAAQFSFCFSESIVNSTGDLEKQTNLEVGIDELNGHVLSNIHNEGLFCTTVLQIQDSSYHYTPISDMCWMIHNVNITLVFAPTF